MHLEELYLNADGLFVRYCCIKAVLDALTDDGRRDVSVEDADTSVVDPVHVTVVVAGKTPPPVAHFVPLSMGSNQSSVTGADGGVNGRLLE